MSHHYTPDEALAFAEEHWRIRQMFKQRAAQDRREGRLRERAVALCPAAEMLADRQKLRRVAEQIGCRDQYALVTALRKGGD
jgi:hypothetical protein